MIKIKALLIISIIYLMGCAKTTVSPTIASYILNGEEISFGEDNPGFNGLTAHLSKLEENETFNLLMIHGMGTTDVSDYDDFVNKIGTQMGYEIYQEFVYQVSEIGDVAFDSTGILIKLFCLKSQTSSKKVNAFFLNWSPATKEYKDSIKAVEDYNNTVCINEKIKKNLVNDSFSDITALNDKDIQLSIFKAMEMILLFKDFGEIDETSGKLNVSLNFNKDFSSQNPAPVIFITGSFGSKITYEFLVNYINFLYVNKHSIIEDSTMMLKCIGPANGGDIIFENINDINEGQYFDILLNDSKQWFALSNQLVLLDAIQYNFIEVPWIRERCDSVSFSGQSDGSLITPEKYNQNLANCRDALNKSLTLVSFFDSNDALGFIIPPKSYKGKIYADTLYNIRLSNAPVRLGIYVNPIKAHNAKGNDKLIDKLVNGWKD